MACYSYQNRGYHDRGIFYEYFLRSLLETPRVTKSDKERQKYETYFHAFTLSWRYMLVGGRLIYMCVKD